jgi:coenzyme PQQ synthesis protein D (PqqD)
MKENLNHCPRRQEKIIVQKGVQEVLLFNMDDGSYYALNEVGNRIWELCDGTHGMAEMVCMLTKEYGTPAEIIETDILELLDDLRSKNLIVGGASPGSPKTMVRDSNCSPHPGGPLHIPPTGFRR